MSGGKIFRELYAHQLSIIHQFDARVKVIFTLAFIVFLNLTPHRAWPAYILFLATVLALALMARLGVRYVLTRALLAGPFVLAAVPLIFTGPPPLSSLHIAPGVDVFYSPEGVGRFVSIAIRSWIAVQAAIILAATTNFPDLLNGLQQLKVPKLFVAIIGLMWRYLYVIGDEVARMLRARSSRSASASGKRHTGGSLYWRAGVTGGMAGSLFLRSIERSDRVYTAMLSRGYTGDLPVSEKSPITVRDLWVLIFGFLLLLGLWILGILTGG